MEPHYHDGHDRLEEQEVDEADRRRTRIANSLIILAAMTRAYGIPTRALQTVMQLTHCRRYHILRALADMDMGAEEDIEFASRIMLAQEVMGILRREGERLPEK